MYKRQIKKTPYAPEEAVSFADESMEMVSYYAIKSSSDLASERGAYTLTRDHYGAKESFL